MRQEPKIITDLRRQAKQLSKAAKITHCQALEEIAKTKGYNTWKGLITALS